MMVDRALMHASVLASRSTAVPDDRVVSVGIKLSGHTPAASLPCAQGLAPTGMTSEPFDIVPLSLHREEVRSKLFPIRLRALGVRLR
jgi:hypothetical protein